MSRPIYRSLLHILTESPDADAAVTLLARLLDNAPGEQVSEITSNVHGLRFACLVFAHSGWLGERVLREPDCLLRLAEGKELERCWSREDFREEFARLRARSETEDLSRLLARLRQREYVRILLRDVLGIARVGEVTEEISALSDACLEEGVLAAGAELMRRRQSPEQVDREGRRRKTRFAVISLGKLGGNELNYSSDLDLLFLYDPDERWLGHSRQRTHFIELAQRTTELLSQPTQEGRVFRIDLRLRPRGHDGDLAVSLPTALKYYSETAEDWELQAMIKARHSAGDESLSREFIRGIAPLVYRPNVNFAAVKTALQARERLDRRGRSRPRIEASGRGIDVKLDRGGIRDIEFLVQCLQRVYGGTETWLQSRGTLAALQKLHDKQHITGTDFQTLSKAYEFLRSVEHRLQLRLGMQSHKLPTNAVDLQVLARCVRSREWEMHTGDDFLVHVRSQMSAVTGIYRRIVYREQISEGMSPNEERLAGRQASGFVASAQSTAEKQEAKDDPELWAGVRRKDISQQMRRRLERFVHSAGTSLERYSALLHDADFKTQALRVFEFSDYLSELVIRHPEDLELVASQGEWPAPKTSEEATDGLPSTKALRTLFRRAMFAASARQLGQPCDIWNLLAQNSATADQAVKQALEASHPPAGLAVLALGRLGSREFDVLSDADLLFVADERADENECRRAAAELMESLAAYTREGRMFPVDARLRPHGGEGELVTSPTRLSAYFSQEARAWEAITYFRFRPVAGNREVAEQAVRSVHESIGTMARRPEFGVDLREMRGRLESSDSSSNLKTGPGGTYDIDFLTGNLQCRHGLWCNGNLAERIDLLRHHGLLQAQDASDLSRNAEFLRRLEHYVRIVTGRSYKWLPPGDRAISLVARLLSADGRQARIESAEDLLRSVMERNHAIFFKYPF